MTVDKSKFSRRIYPNALSISTIILTYPVYYSTILNGIVLDFEKEIKIIFYDNKRQAGRGFKRPDPDK